MSYEELKEIFIKLTFLLRGYSLEDYNDSNSPVQNLIREAYARDSQPFQKIDDKVSYVWVNYSDSEANKVMNTVEKGFDPESEKFLYERQQTRLINVHWIFYGDSAQDLGFEFRQQLTSFVAKDFLDQYGIKLVLNIPEVVLLFEEIGNQYWGRVELTVEYYLVSKYIESVLSIKSIEASLKTENKSIDVVVESEE